MDIHYQTKICPILWSLAYFLKTSSVGDFCYEAAMEN